MTWQCHSEMHTQEGRLAGGREGAEVAVFTGERVAGGRHCVNVYVYVCVCVCV